MSIGSRPLVTLAVPLHRSARFVDSISANIDAVALDDVEIVLSDRHGLDDAIVQLRERHGGDPRCRFVERTDGVGWVRHYEELLAGARGRYLRWMPHDDLYPTCDLARLVARLEASPGALIAYGQTTATELDGTPRRAHPANHPVHEGDGPWSLRTSLDLVPAGLCNGAFKGLVDLGRLPAACRRIRPTLDSINAERAWLFGVSLAGPMVLVDDYHYVKRFHPDSAHAQWEPRPVHALSLGATMLAYLLTVGGPATFARGAGGVVASCLRLAQERRR